MSRMTIQHADEQDFPRMMEIYEYARRKMAENGNPNQWGPTHWPPAELIHKDIREGNSYVCVSGTGRVIGTFFFIQGKDAEPTYRVITDGQWRDDSPYGVVHRRDPHIGPAAGLPAEKIPRVLLRFLHDQGADRLPAAGGGAGRPEFRYVVPDFRLNKAPDLLAGLP